MPENAIPTSERSVLLSDGRLAVMRELTGLDEWEVEQMFMKENIEPRGFGALLYGRALALFALESVGGSPNLPPTDLNDLKMRLASFLSKDLARILKLYARINSVEDSLEGKDAGSPG